MKFCLCAIPAMTGRPCPGCDFYRPPEFKPYEPYAPFTPEEAIEKLRKMMELQETWKSETEKALEKRIEELEKKLAALLPTPPTTTTEGE